MLKNSMLVAVLGSILLSAAASGAHAQVSRASAIRASGIDAESLVVAGWNAAEIPELVRRLDAWIDANGAAFHGEILQVRRSQQALRAAERACIEDPADARLRTALDAARLAVIHAQELVEVRRLSLLHAMLDGAGEARLARFQVVSSASSSLPPELRVVDRSVEDEDRLLRALAEVAAAAAIDRPAEAGSAALVEAEYRRAEVSAAALREAGRATFKAQWREAMAR